MFEKDSYTGEDFSEADELPEVLRKKRFTSCDFSGLYLADTTLDGCVFENCCFDHARLSGRINTCAFLNCSFIYANLLGAEFDGCKMTGSGFSRLSYAGYTITGGDWSYTDIAGLKIKKHRIGAVNFTGACMFECSFDSCDLKDSRFDDAQLTEVKLKNCDINGASFGGVSFGSIDFTGCRADIDFAIMFTRVHGIKI